MPPRKHVSQLEDHLGYWLRFVSNHVSHAFTRKVEAQGVTVAEWVVLRELHGTGPLNPSRLALNLGLTRGAVSKLVDRLHRKKLVEVTHSREDRRSQSVQTTPAGKKLVPLLAKLADDNDREFFGHLTVAQRTLLSEILQDIVHRHGWKDVPTS